MWETSGKNKADELERAAVRSEGHSVVSDSLQPHGLYSPWNSPGQNSGVGSHSLLQWIFATQGSNPGFPHCRWILYQLSQEGSQQGQLTNTKDNSSSLGKLTSVSVPYTPRVLIHILKTAQKAFWTVKASVQLLHIPGYGPAADQEPGVSVPAALTLTPRP